MSPLYGGAERVRTDDLLNANQPLFQLSYGPFTLQRVTQSPAPTPSRLPSISMNSRSSKITKYDRTYLHPHSHTLTLASVRTSDPAAGSPTATLLRLSPNHQHCLRPLPPLRVSSRTSGKTGFHDLTGGVYKARERIQGVVADTPLLAIPASWSRVADIQSELRPIFEIRIASRRSIPLCRPL